MVIGNEVGDEGTPHLQGYVCFNKQLRFNKVKAMMPKAHLEMKCPKSTYFQCSEYCKKDGDFEEFGECPKEPGPSHKKKIDDTYPLIWDAPSWPEARTILVDKRPRDYFLYGETVERMWKKAKTTPYSPLFKQEDFLRPCFGTAKSLLFWGPTNTGKTSFALAHFKKPLLCSHIDDLKKFGPDYDGIVFDDMSFDHWPTNTIIHLLDQEQERSIHIRYGTCSIPRNTPKIFTYNTEYPFFKVESINLEHRLAIERRLVSIHVNAKLFK